MGREGGWGGGSPRNHPWSAIATPLGFSHLAFSGRTYLVIAAGLYLPANTRAESTVSSSEFRRKAHLFNSVCNIVGRLIFISF